MNKCQFCGDFHEGVKCPYVKAIEYFTNGKLKRVEFYCPTDYPQVIYEKSLVASDNFAISGDIAKIKQ